MAGLFAVETTCEAIVRLFEAAYRPQDLPPGQPLTFRVYAADDFRDPMPAGLSLFLYRVQVNDSQRRPLAPGPDGSPGGAQLPLDLHLLLVPWAGQASLQHALLGWAMRVLADHPQLPASVLNGVRPGVFADTETVELVPQTLSNEEMLRLWDQLAADFRLSVPYLARMVRLDPLTPPAGRERVRQRRLDPGVPGP